MHVIEPPIDVDADHPGIDGSAVRSSLVPRPDEALVVTVSRLAVDLKLEALERAIAAVGASPAAARPVCSSSAAVKPTAISDRPADVDAVCGRQVIHFTGEQLDPRPYYAAADVVVGMGSSALRAMAIGRPVVVQGERGFSHPLRTGDRRTFLRQGFCGIGDDGPVDRSAKIGSLLATRPAAELGKFGGRS